jgi:peptidoglycan-associated lipoprotein
MMNRVSLSLSLALSVAIAAGCAHNEKVAKAPTAAPPPAPVARAQPPEPPAPPVEAAADLNGAKDKEGDAIFFDFDSAILRDDARPVLQRVAATLRDRAKGVEIEGNCDETGTVEYNMALGEHRARAAKDYLVHMGVPSTRIATVSFGSQRPKYPGHDDDSHAKNRRDDLVQR